MSGLEPSAGVPVEGEARGAGPVIVVTAVHLSKKARAALAERLGPGHVVRDIRDAGTTADIVLVPAMSGQGVGSLRGMFPGAKILVGEFADDEFGVDVRGPMRRVMEAGVDGYFLAADLAGVAQVTHDAAVGRPVGILGRGAADGHRELDAGAAGPAPASGTLHLVAADDHDQLLVLAARLDAVPLEVAGWMTQLGLDPGDDTVRARTADLAWWIAHQFLSRGADVVATEQRWAALATNAGFEVVTHGS